MKYPAFTFKLCKWKTCLLNIPLYRTMFIMKTLSHQEHDVEITSYYRRLGVRISHRCPYDVILTSFLRWDVCKPYDSMSRRFQLFIIYLFFSGMEGVFFLLFYTLFVSPDFLPPSPSSAEFICEVFWYSSVSLEH